MSRGLSPITTRVEQQVIRFFSPNGLLTIVVLIFLSALLSSGRGIENRSLDRPTAAPTAAVSPILHTSR